MRTNRRGGIALRSSSNSGTRACSDSIRLVGATRTTTEMGRVVRILLMLEIPVCCQEDIEAVSGQRKQFAVLLAAPAHRCHRSYFVPDSNVANGRGNDSSSRTRTGRQHRLGGDFEYSHRLLALHRREVVKELVEGISCRQIIDKVL